MGVQSPNYALGMGQTWQNVTGSRAFDTLYTNSTPRPILVSIIFTATTTSSVSLEVNGAQEAYKQGENIASIQASLQIIVPPNATYKAVSASGPVLVSWAELR